jgi:ATP-dependent DNA helicase RecG
VLNLDEIVDLQQQSLNISFDAYPLKQDLSSLDQQMMDRFFDKVNSTGRANLKKHINLSFGFDGSLKRKETWQYPLEALRELLLNSVIHRDYRNASDIIVKIFDDRIVFTNPGRPYGNLTVEDLKRDDYVAAHRNRLLAEAFYLTGDIEKYGTGFIRVRELLGKYRELTLNIEQMGDFLIVGVAPPPQRPPQRPLQRPPQKSLQKRWCR